jgi:hypothetical protein
MPCFAPKFFEVAKRIIEMTNDCVLVHADFDSDSAQNFDVWDMILTNKHFVPRIIQKN